MPSEATLLAVLLGLIAVVGSILVAAIAAVSATLVRQSKRIAYLEGQARLWWLQVQRLMIHGQTHAPGVPLPEMPEDLLGSTLVP